MKLKLHISILLSALLLFSNIGLAFNVHYCHGEVSGITLTYKSGQCAMQTRPAAMACCAKAAAEKKCCKNHSVKIKDKGDKALVKSLQLNLTPLFINTPDEPLALSWFEYVAADKKTVPAFYTESNAPPLYKLYCQYVLYA